ncbi:MAG TPA: hypothetical protein VK898_00350, partial [Chloroflexota bacterium]|nr:hypothetical protein [Chloroflexota bacterium]
YRGERIVVLGVSGVDFFEGIAQVGTEQLRKAGMNVDLQTGDFTMINSSPSQQGAGREGRGDISFPLLDGLFAANPAAIAPIRGDGKSGAMPGWPDSPQA